MGRADKNCSREKGDALMKFTSSSSLETLLNTLPESTFQWPSELRDDSSGNLQQLTSDFWVVGALYIAADLGIADLLGAGAQRIDELAVATGTHAPSLYQLLRTLVSAGVFAEETIASFTLTPVSQKLRGDIPDSLRPLVLAKLGKTQGRAWGALFRSIRKRPSQKDRGSSQFRSVSPRFSKDDSFVDQGLGSVTARVQAAVLRAYNFSFTGTIVDVGGGDGNFLAFLLQSHEALHGILVEQPNAIGRAGSRLTVEGVSARCKVIAGDFFEFLPTGGDVYVLKGILSDYEDARALRILTNCRRAMSPSRTLLLIDTVAPAETPSFFLNLYGGSCVTSAHERERTAEEFCALLRQAKFQVRDILPVGPETSLIVAT